MHVPKVTTKKKIADKMNKGPNHMTHALCLCNANIKNNLHYAQLATWYHCLHLHLPKGAKKYINCWESQTGHMLIISNN